MNKRHIEDRTHHRQENKFAFVIRNTSTGAYLCDTQLRRRIFPTYRAAERELERLCLSSCFYETEILV